MAPTPSFDPNQPIPNNPFYSPYTSSLTTEEGSLVVGSGLSILPEGTLIATGSGTTPLFFSGPGISITEGVGTVTITNTGLLTLTAGAGISITGSAGNLTVTNTSLAPVNPGTVLQVNSGTGLTGGPITTTGTLSLEPVGSIAPGTYSYPTITVDQYGRVTFASPGLPPQQILGAGAIQVDNLSPQTVSVRNASTSLTGVVQLSDSTSDTSTVKAATASAVKATFDLATSANSSATTALGTAQTAYNAAVTAQTSANTACSLATAACALATTAAADATQALSDAASAQADATQALSDAADAQATADTACTTALSRIPCAAFTSKGQVLVGTGSSAFAPVTPTFDGATLVSDAACPTGTKWSVLPTGTVTSITTSGGICGGPITTFGNISLASTTVTPGTYTYSTITVDQKGRLTAAQNGTQPLLPSVFTEKGQLLTALNAGSPFAFGIGTDGQYLTAKSSSLTGLEWIDNENIPCNVINNPGDILVGNSSGDPSALPVGNTGRFLAANQSCPSKLEWVFPPQGVTAVCTGTGLSGGVITTSGTISLANTTVSAGAYNYASFTVDAQGRILSALSNPAPNTTVTDPIVNTGTALLPVIGVKTATNLQKGVVSVGNNICVTDGEISICDGSQFRKGVVQLENSVSSTDASTALTALQGKILQDQINDLVANQGSVMAGTYDAVNSVLLTVTEFGARVGFVVGDNLPLPAPNNNGYFVIVTVDATLTPPGGSLSFDLTKGDWLYSDSSQWLQFDAGVNIEDASTTVKGLTRYATPAEADAGTLDTVALTPFAISSTYLKSSTYSTKGDILVAEGASTPIALPIGSDGQLLTPCATAPAGLAWVEPDFVKLECYLGKGYLVAAHGPQTVSALAPGSEGQVLTICSLCDTGLTWTPGPGSNRICCSAFTARGEILVGGGPASFVALPMGPSGQILTVDLSTASGLAWKPSPSIPCAFLLNKGDLVTTNGGGIISRLPACSTNGYVLTTCTTSATGLCWVQNDPTGGIQCSVLTAKGSIVVACDPQVPSEIGVGTNGQYLTANSATATGLEWTTFVNEAIPCSTLTDKGALITATSANTPTALPLGLPGQYLAVNTACPGGLEWVTPVLGAGYIQSTVFTDKGQLLLSSGVSSPATLAAGTSGQILVACQTCTQGAYWSDFANVGIPSTVLTGTGSLLTRNSGGTITALSRTGVADGWVLKSCSACANGLAWGAVDLSASIPKNVLVSKGDLIVACGASGACALPIGAPGQVLKVMPECSALGIGWAPDSEGENIPCSVIGDKGYIVAGSGAGVPSALPPGANGQVLRACSTADLGLCWDYEAPQNSIPCSALTAKGVILSSTAANTPAAVPPGSPGQVLIVCTTTPTGMIWADVPANAALVTCIQELSAQVQALTETVNTLKGIHGLP